MELIFDDKTGTWGEAPEVYGTIECPTKEDYEYALKWGEAPEVYGTIECATKEDYEYALNAIKAHKQLEAKHWDECRQIAHYDNDIKSLKAQIADLKRCVKSLNSDYLTGYISALSAVEGMIDKMLGV